MCKLALTVQVLLLFVLPARAEEGGLRAFLVVQGERTLASENPRQRMTPGSVLKLVTTAAALHHLGLEHRVVTVVRAAGSLTGGRNDG